ncbi:hypothetical protein HWC69_gp052 [Gordonia phage Ranch]|uniref:Uncharacterized protein n=1 Tax=Gordonia phage Ranch TaxID=2599848 RepID=A0A5J6TNG7_9CAUD|nr:hypothetical protein HWC69_gp052 [Gordonia phage Ranch]QFG12361.1 hypothetical protein PBI_RANCH_52 [Gordonia phage Ranch]
MNIDALHPNYRPPNNEAVHTIRVFTPGGIETLRLESDFPSTDPLVRSFNGVVKEWGWNLHPEFAEALEDGLRGFSIKSWPIGTPTQWANGHLGTVQFVRKAAV